MAGQGLGKEHGLSPNQQWVEGTFIIMVNKLTM